MKRELLEDLLNWTFDILFELEKRSDWSDYKAYYEIRTPAYLIERFFNVWLEYQKQNREIKILHKGGWFALKNLTLSQKIIKKLVFLIPNKKIRAKIKKKIES